MTLNIFCHKSNHKTKIEELENNIIQCYKDIGKDLTYYDLLIINSDWVEKQLADDLKLMKEKEIINDETIFVITASHSGSYTKIEKDTSEVLIDYLKNYNLKNKIIINDKYISNP